MQTPIRMGISACLLGQEVRYDGGHKLDRFLADTLGRYVDYVPVCPEVEYGLPTPREALRLVGKPESPRLITARTGVDHTIGMLEWAKRRLNELEKDNLCGFIFKSRSPSSGMERIKVYDEHGIPSNHGVGIFARAFMERFPLLPVEDEGRLHDPGLRENFIERIFTLSRWREMEGTARAASSRESRGALVEFHGRHKLLILSHSETHYREMGKLVAAAADFEIPALFARYASMLLDSLRLKATPAKHINVLQHVLGYFKKQLSPDEKQEVLEILAHYRTGDLPLVVPVTLLNHFVRKYDQPYLRSQFYLNPHPLELRLRNHA